MDSVCLRAVDKVFHASDADCHALQAVFLAVEEGIFLIVEGPSGSGKTTLLSIIGCMETASSGTVLVDRTDISSCSATELADIRFAKIGFIFQSYRLVPTLNVYDNILLGCLVGAKVLQRSADTIKRDCNRIIDLVGLRPWVGHRPAELSGGQQQRVAIARAVAKRPRILLADEPTANLDAANGTTVMDLLKQLQTESGMTCIVTSHDSRVRSYADRIVKVQDGRLGEGPYDGNQ